MAEVTTQYEIPFVQWADWAFVQQGGNSIVYNGNLQSGNFSQTSGYQMTPSGDATFRNLTASGKLTVTAGWVVGGFDIGTNYLRDTGDTFGLSSTVTAWDDIRLWAGSTLANFATAPFRVTEAGVLTASSGTVGGWTLWATTLSATWVSIDAGNKKIVIGTSPSISIDGTGTKIESSNYVQGVSGFTIKPTIIEAENIIARWVLKGTTFSYDVVNAVGGQLMVANADALASDMTAQDSSTLTIKGDSSFAVNDILLIKGVATSGIDTEYLRVTNIGSAPTYTVTRDLASTYSTDANPVWKAGTPVVKQGSSDGGSTYSGGWLRLIGEGTNAPYYSVFQRTGVAYNGFNEAVRMGNLNWFLDYSSDLYGIAIGETSKYLKYDSTNGLRMAGDITSLTFFEAWEYLTANDWVMVAADGKVYKTDAGTTLQTNRTIWVCALDTATGWQVPVQMSDKTNFVSWLSLGSTYYIQTPTNNISQDSANSQVSCYNNLWAAQTFTVWWADIVCSWIWVYPFKALTVSDITVSIKATSSDLPTWADLAVWTIPSTNIPDAVATIQYVSFVTPVVLTATTKYAIVLRSPSTSGAGNTISIRLSSLDPYAGWNVCESSNSWASWSATAWSDLRFGITTSLWTIWTSAGVISKKIWIALSSTKLLIQNT